LVFVLFFGALAQYDITQTFNGDSTCGSGYNSLIAVTTGGGCSSEACTLIGGSSNPTYRMIQCNVALPSYPTRAAAVTSYGTGSSCSSSATSVEAYTTGVCINNGGSGSDVSTVWGCTGNLDYNAADCQGNATSTGYNPTPVVNGCYSTSPSTSVYYACPRCFHQDTKITYEGQTMGIAELKTHKSCVIPHEIFSGGLKITTTCEGSLRVTDEHLVYTQNGLVMASTVKVGDFLYQDTAQKKTCEVVAIEAETQQTYFGLNCEDAVVLADGYKVSTFGLTHDLPAIWMKYASKIVGLERASAWGDVLATIFAQLF